MAAPREIRLDGTRRLLRVVWDDLTAELDAEYLRVESPSAEVKGHGAGHERLVSGKRGVSISAVEPVGNYAVKLVFSDGHQTGIYTWDYLRTLGRDHGARWQAYERDLQAAGLSRDATGPMVLRKGLV